LRERINNQIRAHELRVIDSENQNLGVLSIKDALELAQSKSLDLIEINPNANPPIAKIMDFGKYQYEANKKLKKSRAGSKPTETKSIQVKIGTGDHDLELKAKTASKWLKEGHRIKVELFLSGRAKYMDEKFLKEIMSKGQKTHAFICLDDDSIGLQAGFLLLHALQNQKIQILVRMQEDTGLAKFLREVKSTGASLANLQAFGLLDRTCKAEMFDYSTREALARAIHEDYVYQAQKSGSPVSKDNLPSWEELSEELKESNRRQADHIGAKLKAIGCGITPWREYGAERFLFTENEIEIMAYTEHNRWVEEKLELGWQYALERNDALKLHPDLLLWGDERLTEDAREKDRNAARLLPALLARAGFQIYRIQK